MAQLQENHYLQFLIGLESYIEEAPLDSSMMVHFCKRINTEIFMSINERIYEKMVKKTRKMQKKLKKKKLLK